MANLPAYRTAIDAENALVVAISGPFLTHKVNGPEEAHALSVLLDFGLSQLYTDGTGSVNAHAIPAGSILQYLPWKTIVTTILQIVLSQLPGV